MKTRLARGLATWIFLGAQGIALPALGETHERPESVAKEEAPRIAVVAPPEDPFGRRLVAEFETLGIETILIAPEGPVSRTSLEAVAKGASAVAAIRTVPSEKGIEVWIADRVTGKTVLRELAKGDSSPESEAALTLRVVELLRASLLETKLKEAPRGEFRVPPALDSNLEVPKAREPLKPPSLWAGVSLGGLWSGGEFSAIPDLGLDLAWIPTPCVGISAFGAIPLSPATITKNGGTRNLSPILVGGSLRITFMPNGSTWFPWLDAGVAALLLRPSSAETPPVVAPYFRLGLAHSITSSLRLRADVLLGDFIDTVVIRAYDGTFGQLVLMGSVGVEVGLLEKPVSL